MQSIFEAVGVPRTYGGFGPDQLWPGLSQAFATETVVNQTEPVANRSEPVSGLAKANVACETCS